MALLDNVNLILDNLCRVYLRLLSEDGATNYGAGEPGQTYLAAGAAQDIQAAVLASTDVVLIGALLTPATQGVSAVSASRITQNAYRSLLNKLQRHVNQVSGTATLDQFLALQNNGVQATNGALQNPAFRAIYHSWKGVYPSARNLYFEILQGATYANALRKLVVGTGETAGTSVSTDYAGGVPFLKVSGFTGSSGLVTVTGTEFNPVTGVRTTNKTWTATVTGDGDFALVSGGGSAASSNALIVAVSGISAAGSITASTTIFVEARKPSGRLPVPF